MKTSVLADVAEWGSGGTPRRGVAKYFGEGTPWLSIADLNDGVVCEARESLTPAGIANSSAKVVPAGTVFVAMYGSIGKLGVAGREMCTSQAIAFAKPRTELVDRQYLFNYLLAQRSALQAVGRGGTQMNIGQGDLKAWPIPLPPLDEQRRIAAILDDADALRATRTQILTHLDALTRSIFHDMFGSISDSRWEHVPLGEVVGKIDNGTSPNCETRPARGTEVGVLKLGAVTYGVFQARQNKAYLGEVGSMMSNEVRAGDVLMARKNTRELVGAVALVDEVRCGLLLPDLIFRLDLDESRVDRRYFQALMMHPAKRPSVRDLSSGSAASMPNISKARLRGLALELPPLGLQRDFAAQVECINMQRAAVQRGLAADHELFGSLQSHAFRGEL